ncbi:MAG: hypothetical protein KC517_07490 [Bacteroidetes bacterium]|jgi:hypothetical protein|nr:hypothetical protein [Bacteroidota bacterium]
MKGITLGVLLALVCLPRLAKAQNTGLDVANKWYANWGWNRGWYTKSDIRMTGKDYDFTLDKVAAKDRQTKFGFKEYLFITQLSVPQTNLNVGYYVNKHYSIAGGFDHMKYVMVRDQTTTISGDINRRGSGYNGTYDNDSIQLGYHFLRYEHTDGLNYVFLEFNRHDEWFNLKQSKIRISSVVGAGPALLRPRTDVTLLNRQGRNVYHNAGYGVNGKLGLHVLLFNHFNIISEVKGGYINMQHIQATEIKEDIAKQQFGFLQVNVQIGATFGIKKRG